MPVKIARSTPRPSFGLPEPLVGIHTSRQSCCKAAKARPLHIHINPFRVTEFFDPNESFVDKTGTLVDRYVLDKDAALIDGQCRLDLDKEATWKPCYDTRKSDW
jgi:hypothetical protein